MSTLKTTNITHGSNSGTSNVILASDGKVTVPTNKLACPGVPIQVVTDSSNSSATCSDTTAIDIPNLSASITASHANNIILAWMTVGGIYSADDANSAVELQLVRDSSIVAKAINIGMGSVWSLNLMGFLMYSGAAGDTNAHTYKGMFRNRQSGDVKVAQVEATHFITLMEIAQ